MAIRIKPWDRKYASRFGSFVETTKRAPKIFPHPVKNPGKLLFTCDANLDKLVSQERFSGWTAMLGQGVVY